MSKSILGRLKRRGLKLGSPTQIKLAIKNCQYCDTEFKDREPNCIEVTGWGHSDFMTMDHKLPRSSGGSIELHNLVVSCYLCNRLRNRDTYYEFCAFAEKYIKPYRKDFTAMIKAMSKKPNHFPKAALVRTIIRDNEKYETAIQKFYENQNKNLDDV